MKQKIKFSMAVLPFLLAFSCTNDNYDYSESTSTLMSRSTNGNNNDLAAKKIKIDEWITDTHGGSHHIHGWIDVGLFPPQVNHWDIYYDSTHFVGKMVKDSEGDELVVTQENINEIYDMHTYDEKDEEIKLESIDYFACYEAMYSYAVKLAGDK